MPRVQTVKGLRELSKKLSRLPPETGGKFLRSAAGLSMKIVQTAAEQRIPVSDRDYVAHDYRGQPILPGHAKRSIVRRTKLTRDKQCAWADVGVKKSAFYAIQFVELGTSKMKRQPWLEPALRRNRNRVTQDMARRLAQKIKREAKKKVR